MPPKDDTIATCPRCRAPVALSDGKGTCRRCGTKLLARPGAPLSPPIVVQDGPGQRPPRPAADNSRLLWLMFLGFGLLFGLVGAVLGFLWTRYDPAAEDRALSQLSAAALSDSAAGREVLVEGRLSPRNLPRDHGLIVYTRDALRGSGDDERWVTVERFAPRLLVELPDGPVEVLSEGAFLQSSPRTVAESPRQRVEGFGPGDPVVVIGRVVEGPEGPAIAAERIVAGTRDDYLAALGAQRHVLLWIGGPFMLFGLFVGGLGAWGLLRARR